MNEIILKEQNGNILASSFEVAEKFGKEHSKVKRSIKSLEKDVANFGEMFTLSYYEDSYGRKQEEYSMNRDGFSLIVMGFTGKKALEWKLKYIEAFNKMEEKLKQGSILTEEEKLKLQLFSKDVSEVAYAHNKLIELATTPLRQQIEEQKPLVEFANKVSDSSNLIDMGKMAKLLKDENINIGRNRLFDWLRHKEILMKNNMPYQRYIEVGYFQVKESTYETPYGTKTQQTTYVTGKGQIYITEKLRKEWNKEIA